MNDQYVKSRIIRLCSQPRTFDYLCNNLDGLDPTMLVCKLKELEKDHRVQKKHDLWVITEKLKNPTLDIVAPDPHSYLKRYMGYFDFLKTPHPLDFEWRNSTASLTFLNNMIQDLCPVNSRILYLGMPTLFATGYEADIPHRVTLIERNKPIVDSLSRMTKDNERFVVTEADIFEAKPQKFGKYNFVMMDPPWYSRFFYQFMWLSSQCVEPGGIVGASLPPINTKDDILDERLAWLQFCRAQGLCLESLLKQQLHYTMPFFEFNALRAFGIDTLQPFWRKGDLAFFRKVTATNSERPVLEQTSLGWLEKEVDSVRIRVRATSKRTKQPVAIAHLVKGDILPSVSKGDERRKLANVWTSGNRIFSVTNPDRFVELLDEIKRGGILPNRKEQDIADLVQQIVTFEKREYNNYLDWLYHEMERQTY